MAKYKHKILSPKGKFIKQKNLNRISKLLNSRSTIRESISDHSYFKPDYISEPVAVDATTCQPVVDQQLGAEVTVECKPWCDGRRIVEIGVLAGLFVLD